jgi:outer membrane receptor for ferrienterochelin and colicins
VSRRRSTGRSPVPPLLYLLASLSGPGALAAQSIRGTVRDSLADAPLGAVRIELTGADVARVTVSDPRGSFSFNGVPDGRYRLRLTRVGYAVRMVEAVRPGTDPLVLHLTALGAPLDPVVVSASRREEATLDAPAAVTVLDRAALAASPALETVGQVSRAPGVNAANKGLIQQTFSARGGNTVNSGGLLLLHDFRYAAIPSIAFNVPYLVPVTADDVDRIEVIRGPAAALYGPGAPTGVVHVLTRSPFDERGGSVTLTAGTRSVAGGGFRYAVGLGPALAAKLSGEYLRGRDWDYVDPEEARALDAAVARGADPDTLRIARRDPTVERALVDARVDWRPALGTEVTLAVGAAQALGVIDLTPAFGAVQGHNWRYSYAQLRARRGRLSGQALYDWSDAGDSYTLRDGVLVVDRSRVLVAQLQHGATVGAADLLYGADGRWTDPRTEGTVNGANEDDDLVAELGGYAHADLPLSRTVRAVGALRVDRHNRLNDLVVSPRVGLVLQPAPTHAFRLTYNRAFTSPDANDLFLDRLASPLEFDVLRFPVRGVGVPREGYTFPRHCDGGLCMRSQFYSAGPSTDLPLDVTELWGALVGFAGLRGVDLSNVPRPTAADVRTNLALLDLGLGAFRPVDPADFTTVAGEGRTITNVAELGYRGVLAGRLALAAEVWVNRALNVPGPLEVITPSAFFDEETLRAYLEPHVGADTAALIADLASMIPAGTVSPDPRYQADLLVVAKRGGAYTLWGADLAATLDLASGLAVSASYSWTSNDTIPDVRDVGTFYLNLPRSKGTAGLSYRHPSGVTAAVAARWVSAFRVNSGLYTGRVEDYLVADLSAGLPVPGWPEAELQLTGQNLVGGRHREMIGAPEIGRLFLARLRVGF